MSNIKATELRIGNLVNLMLNHEDFGTLRVTLLDMSNIEKITNIMNQHQLN
jgi:hypothetical protein